jgi:hypothetical protein
MAIVFQLDPEVAGVSPNTAIETARLKCLPIGTESIIYLDHLVIRGQHPYNSPAVTFD